MRLPSAGTGSAINGEAFTVLGWIYPTSIDATNTAALFTISNTLHIELLPGGTVSARIVSLNGSDELIATADGALQPNEWVLVAASFEGASGTLALRVASETNDPITASVSDALFVPSNAGSQAIIGATNEQGGMVGLYGILAVRDHTIHDQDFAAVWDSRSHHAPYSMETTDIGGHMNGHDGCIWMINHAITTFPNNAGAGGTVVARAAIVGEPVTVHNCHVLDQTGPGQNHFYRSVRKVDQTSGFIYRSPFDPPHGEFFQRTIPVFEASLPDPPLVAHVAPTARQLATGPEGLVKVIISANSRGVLASDRSEKGSANFSQGFAAIKQDQTAGILNRPARLLSEPWFGLDSTDDAPYFSGPVIDIENTDFSRFWTGAGQTPRIGPGRGLRLEDQATYAIRCRNEGLIEAEHPLLIRAHLLRYPGSSNLSWIPNQYDRQGESGTDVGEAMTVELDTTTYLVTCGEDGVQCTISGPNLTLTGDHTATVLPGDAVFITNGTISIVENISFDGGLPGTTYIKLERHLSSSPGPGDSLMFGPWAFKTIQHMWPGLAADDPLTWRGMRLTAQPGGYGAIVFSFSAWRPDVDGFVFGPAGWSGHGYKRQIADTFKEPMRGWMQELAPDIWLQAFAQQGSEPSTMAEFGAIVREALPNVDLVWIGDMVHENEKSEDWNHYILDNAESFGVPAIVLAQHPHLGNMLELYADGLRMDTGHANQRGNERMAELWTELLLQAALVEDEPGVVGDLNGDGVVNVLDLLILIGEWGQCPEPNDCPADFNGDGVVNVPDLLILLDNWG